MDEYKILKTVTGLDEYITASEDVSSKCANSKISFNMSLVLALKKVRSLEIEYFNKCDGNGVAFIIFDRLLKLPPSKTWSILGKEMILLLQYWLDALRKHLISHCPHWWKFLKGLLQFIRDIRLKASLLSDILVQEIVECLLDLATNSQLNALQQHEVIYSMNLFCATSSREVRYVYATKLRNYFIKLSLLLSTIGHVPSQFMMMETLLRFLLRRQDRSARLEAAEIWFTDKYFSMRAVNIFLERTWQDFHQDARDFLNAHNDSTEKVTSVICKKLIIGEHMLASSGEKRATWLDMNSGSSSLSVLLHPRALEPLGAHDKDSCEILIIANDNADSVRLMRNSSEVTLSIAIVDVNQLFPTSSLKIDGVITDVTAAISSRSDLKRVDRILRQIFNQKYQVLLDFDNVTRSPEKRESLQKTNCTDDETRFSHPVEVKRRKQSGYAVRSKDPVSWKSPSTASTSSLAQLHDKLAALPRYRFDKEPISVCALPALSNVSEVTEIEDQPSPNSSLNTTKIRRVGTSHKVFHRQNKDSESDSESIKKKLNKCLSPEIKNDGNTSCLLVATVGSVEESIINETLERLPKYKDLTTDNIVDLLAQEAFEYSEHNKINELKDCNVLAKNIKSQETEIIEDTPQVLEQDALMYKQKNQLQNTKPKKTAETSTDESNTEVINETPACFINVKNRQQDNQNSQNHKLNEKPLVEFPQQKLFDDDEIENIISQNICTNNVGTVNISPTLARKINETSSESSEDPEEQYHDFDEILGASVHNQHDDLDVFECLNNIVERVCEQFDKCSKILSEKSIQQFENLNNPKVLKPNNCIIDTFEIENASCKKSPKKKSKQTIKQTDVTLTYKLPTRKVVNKEPQTYKEKKANSKNTKDSITFKSNIQSETPILLHRKRKLYSPKDEQIRDEQQGVHIPETEDDDTNMSYSHTRNITDTASAACYKEIEKERQLNRKSLRKSRISKTKFCNTNLSPRSKKNNEIFDNLKEKTEGLELIKLVDKKSVNKDTALYNFTSDSEDEDFKKKKVEIQKRLNTPTTGKTKEPLISKHGRITSKVNYSEIKTSKSTNADELKKGVEKKKKVPKRSNAKRIKANKNNNKNEYALLDEKMREANYEDNNNSFISESNNKKSKAEELKPMSRTTPKMEFATEPINVEEHFTCDQSLQNKSKKNKKGPPKTKKKIKESLITDCDRTTSPLPGLLIEKVPLIHNDINDSGLINTSMMQQFKRIYKGELDDTQKLLLELDKSTTNQVDDVVEVSSFDINCNKAYFTQAKSEKSISTMGKSPITGHGDFDEPPPDSKCLIETFAGRNLEIENLNQSMADYYIQLRDEITKPSSVRSIVDNLENKQILTQKTSDDNMNSSPQVVVSRLAFDDFKRWLPSSRSSVSVNSTDVTEIKNKSLLQKYNLRDRKKTSKAQSVSSTETKTCVQKISFEEFSRFWPMPEDKSDDECKSVKKIESKFSKPKKRCNEVQVKKVKSTKKSTKPPVTGRKSTISPIMLLDGILDKEKNYFKSPNSNESAKLSNSSQKIDCNTNNKDFNNVNDLTEEPITNERFNLVNQNMSVSLDSNVSSSTRILSNDVEKIYKTKCSSSKSNKKRKLDENLDTVSIIESGSSVSVDQWFKGIESAHVKDHSNALVRDSIGNILEKLDTTLLEIHHDTSTRFAHMCLSVQEQLCEKEKSLQALYQNTAKEMLSGVVKLVDESFQQLHQKSIELDKKFRDDLKSKTFEVIKQDCEKKRTMMNLLREDLDNLKKF